MIYNDFEFICQDKILDYYSQLKKIDGAFYHGKALTLDRRRLNRVYYYYEGFRKDIRRLYMSEDRSPMDRHKIASNLMCSLLKARPIHVNRLIPGLKAEILFANEYLAFYVAVSVVENYKRYWTGIEDYQLDLFPETYQEEGGDSYLRNTCKALYYLRPVKMKDIFAYANILFWLERYTDEKLGLSVKGNPPKD